MASGISEASLHAFHLSRLTRRTSTSSIDPLLDDEPFLRRQLVDRKPRISEADVHAYHLAHLSHQATSTSSPKKRRKSLPLSKGRAKRPVPIRRSTSTFSIIHLSASSPQAHVPHRALSPKKFKTRRDSGALPYHDSSESDDDDDEVDRLRSSSMRGRRDASSNTSVSSMIPSSPLPLPAAVRRPKALGMVGMDRGGWEGGRTPGTQQMEGVTGGSGRMKRKGPSWVTTTPVGVGRVEMG